MLKVPMTSTQRSTLRLRKPMNGVATSLTTKFGASCWSLTSAVWTWNTGEMMYPQKMKTAAKQLMGELANLDL